MTIEPSPRSKIFNTISNLNDILSETNIYLL